MQLVSSDFTLNEIDHIRLNRAALRECTKLVRFIRDRVSGPAESCSTSYRRTFDGAGHGVTDNRSVAPVDEAIFG